MRAFELFLLLLIDVPQTFYYLTIVKAKTGIVMISDDELKVFNALERAIKCDGLLPTLRDLEEETGFSHEHARAQLIKLEKKGYIWRAPFRTRALKILRRPDEAKAAA